MNQALATLVAEHPDATPMTVFQSKDQVEGFLPATKAAMGFLSSHPALVSRYPYASTYFIPMPDTKGKFDLNAYQEQKAEGLRLQKTPAEFWSEVVYQQAASDYFAVDNYKNTQVAQGADPTSTNELWAQFSQNFMAANPVFAQMYSDRGPVTRGQIMEQVGGAINSKVAPPGPQTADIATLYNSYVAWQNETQNFGQPNAPSSDTAYPISVSFVQWVSNFVKDHPDVQPLVDRVVRPELSRVLTEMAAQGIGVTF
jgi:hypothetical protein